MGLCMEHTLNFIHMYVCYRSKPIVCLPQDRLRTASTPQGMVITYCSQHYIICACTYYIMCVLYACASILVM